MPTVARKPSYLRALWRTTNSRKINHSILPSPIRSNAVLQHSSISYSSQCDCIRLSRFEASERSQHIHRR